MTKKIQTNLIGSTTSTTENLPQERTVCRAINFNKNVNTIKAHTTKKTNNIEKAFYCSNDQNIYSSNRSSRS